MNTHFQHFGECLRNSHLRHSSVPLFQFVDADLKVQSAWTAAELDRRARTIAAHLQQQGAVGKRALLLYPAGLDYVAAFLGCLYAGVVAVPSYPVHTKRSGRERLALLVADAGADWVLTDAASAQAVAAWRDEAPATRAMQVVVTDTIPSELHEYWREPKLGPNDLAFLQYTSGSTGNPKGVMVSHGNLLANQNFIRRAFAVGEGDHVAGWLPLYHDMGLIGNVLQPIFSGVPATLTAPMTFLRNPLSWLQIIADHGATIAGGPNFAYELCVRRIDRDQAAQLDLSRWTRAFNGAEPIRAQTLSQFAEHFAVSGFKKTSFFCCYGLAEATLLVSGSTPGEQPVVQQTPDSQQNTTQSSVGCGRIQDDVVVKIVDPATGTSLPEGQVGELWLAGPSIAQGYWGQDDLTKELFQARLQETPQQRYLRSGDLGFLQNGTLFINGRLKDLIVIRGRNYYPQDIEQSAACHEALVVDGAAAFSVDVAGEERLVLVHEVGRTAWRRLDAQRVMEAMRRAVSETHDVKCDAVLLIKQSALPKTSSGKVRRSHCRKLFLAGDLDPLARWSSPIMGKLPARNDDANPATAGDLETWLNAWLQERTGDAALTVNWEQTPAAHGLDSLDTADLLAAWEGTLGGRLPATFAWENARFSELRQALSAATSAQSVPAVEDHSALSAGQTALYHLQLRRPSSCAYNIALAAEHAGELCAQRLADAFSRLLARRPMLRRRFRMVEDDLQLVENPSQPLPFEHEIAENWDQTQIDHWINQNADRPFDLNQSVTPRLHLLTLFEDGKTEPRAFLLWVVHHTLCDLQSLELLAKELSILVAGKSPEPTPAATFAQFVQAARHADLAAARNYWGQTLQGDWSPTELNLGRPRREGASGQGDSVWLSLDPDHSSALRRQAQRRETSPHNFFLAAVQTLLFRYTEQTDVVIGEPISLRDQRLFANTLGDFTNVVPLRCALNPEASFAAQLAQTTRLAAETRRHADLPLAEILREAKQHRLLSADHPVQILFVWHRESVRSEAPNLFQKRLPGSGQRGAPYPLTWFVIDEGETFSLRLQFDTSYFSKAVVTRLAENFNCLLAAFVADPTRRLTQPAILGPKERALATISAGWTVPVTGLTPSQRFARQVQRHPEHAALTVGETDWTYGQLQDAANRIADRLHEAGVTRGDRVGICLPRDARLPAALLAVLQCGACYVPLDPNYPSDRLAFIAADAQLRLVLTAEVMPVELPKEVATRALEALKPRPKGATVKADLSIPGATAYIIYTSGSTGTPKGVAVSHANADALIDWAEAAFDTEDWSGVLAATSVCFDLSVFEIFVPLALGGRVILADQVLQLPQLPARDHVRLLNSVPSALQSLAEENGIPASVRTINSAGEPLTRALSDRLFQLPHVVKLNNLYGPSEDTTYSTAAQVTRAGDEEPTIGRPLPGTTAYVLDRELNPVPAGVIGTLYLAGSGLSLGYAARPGQTAAAFLPNPFSERPGDRMYHTGDLVRRHENGELVFLGRRDHQVKFRGFRIELGEIETELLRLPGITAAAVLLTDRGPDSALIAFVSPTVPDTKSLKAELAQVLPAYMVPSQICDMAALPQTPNGKIDRRALAQQGALLTISSVQGEEIVLPRHPVEAKLAQIWGDLLGLTQVGVHQHFFELGGHSLLVLPMLTAIEKEWSLRLPYHSLFDHPTVADLARLIISEGALSERPQDAAPTSQTADSEGDSEDRRLNFGQEQLWFVTQMNGGAAYTMPIALRLRGTLARPALARAFQTLLQIHPLLRSRIELENGAWLRTLDAVDAPQTWFNEAPFPAGLSESDLAEREARRPFDLNREWPIRVQLYSAGEQHLLLVTLHHIVADAFSVRCLLQDFSNAYNGLTVASPQGRYDQFVSNGYRALQDGRWDQGFAYWHKQLAEASPTLPHPDASFDPEQPGPRGYHTRLLPPSLWAQVKRVAEREHQTPFATLLAAYVALLRRVCRQDDVMVATPAANRLLPGSETQVGFFVNMVNIRVQTEGAMSAAALRETAGARLADALRYQEIPLEKLVERLGPHIKPQTVFTLADGPLTAPDLRGLDVAVTVPGNGLAKFPLTLTLTPTPRGLQLEIEYHAAGYEEATVVRLAEDFQHLLEAGLNQPQQPLRHQTLLSETRRAQILQAGKGAPTHDGQVPVPIQIAAWAKQTPEAPAVSDGHVQLSYAALQRGAAQLAGFLASKQCGAGDLVALLLPRTAAVAVAQLAVWKTGAAFVSIDPTQPPKRIAHMLQHKQIRWAVTAAGYAVPTEADTEVIDLDALAGSISEATPYEGPAPAAVDPAYVIFTSGTTGLPKGVRISHGALANLAAWHQRCFPLDADLQERVALSAGLGFDASIWELHSALCAGVDARFVPETCRRDAQPLVQWLTNQGITRAFLPTPLAEALMAETIPADFPLRLLLTGGDRLRAPRLAAFGGRVRLFNLYGPTENTVVSTGGEIMAEDRGAPTIGRALDGVNLMVLDQDSSLQDFGRPGELCLSGAGLALDYLDSPAQTADKFRPNPFAEEPGSRLYHTGDLVRLAADGRVEFLGRRDGQIKLRGFRLELGEVETALLRLPKVTQAAAILKPSPPGGGLLVAHLVADGRSAEDCDELRRLLGETLPAHAVPTLFKFHNQLPLTANGKVDRRALAAQALESPDATPEQQEPRTATERAIAAIWCEVLERDTILRDDHFFELGGHSLPAARAAARIRTELNRNLALADFFAHPTLSSLAAFLDGGGGTQTEATMPALVHHSHQGQAPLSFAQQRLWFIDQLEGANAAYVLPITLRLQGSLDIALLQAALGDVTARHESLRTHIGHHENQPVQVIAAPAPFPLEVVPLDLDDAAYAAFQQGVLPEALDQLIDAETYKPFNLGTGPLFRAKLIRLRATDHLLPASLHHIIADGWAVSTLSHDLHQAMARRLAGEPPHPPAKIQYADFAVWQRRLAESGAFDSATTFWKQHLAGAPSSSCFPTDFPRPNIQRYAGKLHFFHIPKALHQQLGRLANTRKTSLYNLLLSVYAVLLQRYNGADEQVIGVLSANRERVEVEAVIGLFVNTLAIRIGTDPQRKLRDLVDQVHGTMNAAAQHAQLPFEMVVDAVQPERNLSFTPLFQTLFVLQNQPQPRWDLPGLSVSAAERRHAVSKFDVTLSLEEQADGLHGSIEYAVDLFRAETIARLARHFVQLLEAAVGQPEQTLARLSFLSAEERQTQLQRWNATATPYARENLLHQLVAHQVTRTPDATALVAADGGETTYAELNRRVNQLAHRLIAMGVGAESRVGVCMTRGPEMVIALLAVLKAGGAYLPLDPAYPEKRLAYMVDDADLTVLILEDGAAPLPPNGVTQLPVTPGIDPAPNYPDHDPRTNTGPDHLAYMIYTSGSTGLPKGVMVSHRNAVNFCAAMDGAVGRPNGAATSSRWLAVTSMSFDISVLELFWTLAQGRTVVIQPDPPARQTPHARDGKAPAFSLFYFAAEDESYRDDRYRLLHEGARFADQNDFTAVWVPERHFHGFGEPFPNPSVAAASVASITENIAIRSGSVVLPLHDPIRVAEEWSMVDNLSRGRVGLSFASGWHPNDFVLQPENFEKRHALMYEYIETFRALWRGETIRRPNGVGQTIDIGIRPRPKQDEPPIWITTAGNIATFESAGRIGANILTHLLGQDVNQLAEKIAAYRKARAAAGLNPDSGQVTLMLHTFLGEDLEQVRGIVREPFKNYLRASLNLLRPLAEAADLDLQGDLEALLDMGFERFFDTSSLMGTPAHCEALIQRVNHIGVDEIACLIDFGVPADQVTASLPTLAAFQTRLRTRAAQVRRLTARPQTTATYHTPAEMLHRHGVTHLQCTPSFVRLLSADPEGRRALAGLTQILVGGEPLPADLAETLTTPAPDQSHAPQLLNMYGPTETTVWSTVAEITPQNCAKISIGRPVANTDVYILNEAMNPVPPGCTGELYIGGDGVTRGYHNRPSLTAERFVPHPFARKPGQRLYRTGDVASFQPSADGRSAVLQFGGRADRQVKLRGFRIEPSEIEARLNRIDGVSESHVMVREDVPGDKRLVAYLRGRRAGLTPPPKLDQVAEGLQHYVLPNGLGLYHNDPRQLGPLFDELFDKALYLRHGISLQDNDVIFDAGANVGGFSMFVNSRIQGARIYAFEPIPPTFEVLATNARYHNLGGQVFNLGLSNHRETTTFTYYPHMSGLSSRFGNLEEDRAVADAFVRNQMAQLDEGIEAELDKERDIAGLLAENYRAQQFECTLTTLSDMIDQLGISKIDLLKVDVEKSECLVLEGIREEHWPLIGQIAMEVDGKENLATVEALLTEKGFKVGVDDLFTVAAQDGRPEMFTYMLYGSRPAYQQRPATPIHQNRLNAAAVRDHLKQDLPEYMLPADVVFLDSMPRTPNGKLNSKALPAPNREGGQSGQTFVAPGNERQRKIAAIWRSVLRRDPIGINDNFFELGGNSLLLAQVVAELRKTFSTDISLVELMRRTTVADLAAYYAEKETATATTAAQDETEERADRRRDMMRRRRQRRGV